MAVDVNVVVEVAVVVRVEVEVEVMVVDVRVVVVVLGARMTNQLSEATLELTPLVDMFNPKQLKLVVSFIRKMLVHGSV